MKKKTLHPEVLEKMDAYWRAANHLQDAVDRLQHLGSKGAYLKQMVQDKLVEHKQYIGRHGEDVPEVWNRKWGLE
jgi:phosphoketolase